MSHHRPAGTVGLQGGAEVPALRRRQVVVPGLDSAPLQPPFEEQVNMNERGGLLLPPLVLAAPARDDTAAEYTGQRSAGEAGRRSRSNGRAFGAGGLMGTIMMIACWQFGVVEAALPRCAARRCLPLSHAGCAVPHSAHAAAGAAPCRAEERRQLAAQADPPAARARRRRASDFCCVRHHRRPSGTCPTCLGTSRATGAWRWPSRRSPRRSSGWSRTPRRRGRIFACHCSGCLLFPRRGWVVFLFAAAAPPPIRRAAALPPRDSQGVSRH